MTVPLATVTELRKGLPILVKQQPLTRDREEMGESSTLSRQRPPVVGRRPPGSGDDPPPPGLLPGGVGRRPGGGGVFRGSRPVGLRREAWLGPAGRAAAGAPWPRDPTWGTCSPAVVSAMSSPRGPAGRRGLEPSGGAPVPGHGKDRQTFRGGGRTRSPACWLSDVCLVPVTHV